MLSLVLCMPFGTAAAAAEEAAYADTGQYAAGEQMETAGLSGTSAEEQEKYAGTEEEDCGEEAGPGYGAAVREEEAGRDETDQTADEAYAGAESFSEPRTDEIEEKADDGTANLREAEAGIDIPYEEFTDSVTIGDTVTLETDGEASNGTVFKIVWEIPDNGILSLSGDTVTGLAEGYAAATGYAVVGSEKYLCQRHIITVHAAASGFSVKGTSVEAGKVKSLEIMVGQISDKIPYGKVPAGTVTVTSMDESIAAVTCYSGMVIGGPKYDSFSVKGVKPGTAAIAVTLAETGETKYAQVTVTEAVPEIFPVTGIKLNRQSAGLFVGRSFQAKASVFPEDATDKRVIWKSSDTMVATVDQTGKISAKRRGKAIISCTAKDGSGTVAACTVTVKIPVSRITLSRSSISLKKGRSSTLEAVAAPRTAWSRSVSWSSSDPSIVSVSSAGRIIAKSPGKATVTCTAKDGSGVKAACKVTVTGTGTKVSGISLNRTNAALLKGKTVQLNATVSPSSAADKTVTWKSSNTAVATVDGKGKVTAKGKGTAAISCTAKDGSGKKAVCKVTVNIPVSKITLNRTSATISEDSSVQLTASVAPSSADNKTVAWTSSDTSVAAVSGSGKVSARSAGTAVVTCRAKDGSGIKAVCTVTVTSSQPSQSGPPYEVGSMVWVSATGSKYHTIDNCGTMNPNNARHISISEARSRGLTPCSKCCK